MGAIPYLKCLLKHIAVEASLEKHTLRPLSKGVSLVCFGQYVHSHRQQGHFPNAGTI
jgi:hypothetical protein